MGNVLSTAVEKAKVFDRFFCLIYTKENISNLALLRNLLWDSWCTQSIMDVALDENEVCEMLCKIDSSKACGPDEILGHLIREGAPWLAEQLPNCSPRPCSQGSFQVTGGESI